MPEFICSDVRRALKLAIADKRKIQKMRRETTLRFLYSESNYVTFWEKGLDVVFVLMQSITE